MSEIITPAPFNIIKSRPFGIVVDKRTDGLFDVHGDVGFAIIGPDGEMKDYCEGHNLVCTAGVNYYNHRLELSQPANDEFTTGAALAFDGVMELFTGTITSPTSSADRDTLTAAGVSNIGTNNPMTVTSTYPKLNDSSTNNGGKGAQILTYRYDFGASDAIDPLPNTNVIITNPSPGGTEPLLMWSQSFTNFTKTGTDSIEAFVNHTLSGV